MSCEIADKSTQNVKKSSKKLKHSNPQLFQIDTNKNLNVNYEHNKAEEAKQQRKDIENEISRLLEKQNSLQEFLQDNISFVNNWTKETAKKIKKANAIVTEYEEYTNEMDRQYVEELREAVLNALGDIPEPPQIDFEAPTASFNNYDEEEYEL